MVIGPNAVLSLAVTAPSSCLMVTASIGLPAPMGTTGQPLLPAPTQLLLHHIWICASTTTPTSPFHHQIWCGTARVARNTTCTAPAQTLPHLAISAPTHRQTLPLTLTTTPTTTLCLHQVASAVERTTTAPTTTLLHLTATTIPTHTTPNRPPAQHTMT